MALAIPPGVVVDVGALFSSVASSSRRWDPDRFIPVVGVSLVLGGIVPEKEGV